MSVKLKDLPLQNLCQTLPIQPDSIQLLCQQPMTKFTHLNINQYTIQINLKNTHLKKTNLPFFFFFFFWFWYVNKNKYPDFKTEVMTFITQIPILKCKIKYLFLVPPTVASENTTTVKTPNIILLSKNNTTFQCFT